MELNIANTTYNVQDKKIQINGGTIRIRSYFDTKPTKKTSDIIKSMIDLSL